MEKNTYLFIIWNKVLWAKKRIIDDLSNSFEIVKEVNVSWDNDDYLNNLLALYGTKTNDASDKLKAIGYGEFCLILVKDNNEEFSTIKKYDREEYVNRKINEKKKLYRKWTGTDFRIHSSENYNETVHDLTILFGHDYENIINNSKGIIHLNTKGVQGFDDIEDFCECVKNFGDLIYKHNSQIYVLARKRNDLLRFVSKYNFNSDNDYSLKIGNQFVNVYIFGEEEGELPNGLINLVSTNKNFEFKFVDLLDKYVDKNINDNNVIELFNEYKLSINLVKKQTIRKKEKRTVVVALKKKIKYYFAWLSNKIYLLKNK